MTEKTTDGGTRKDKHISAFPLCPNKADHIFPLCSLNS